MFLLGAFPSMALSYIMMFTLTRYIFIDLFIIKRRYKSVFFMTTTENYLVIDYQKWKKGAYSSMNFLYKFVHTSILEVFASCMFTLSLYMEKGPFKSFIVILIFCLAAGETFRFMKAIGKTAVKELSHISSIITKDAHLKLIKFSLLMISVCIWLIAIASEIGAIFSLFSLKIPITGVIALYIVLTTSDLIRSKHFGKNRKDLKEEGRLKQKYIALCEAFTRNDEKIFERIQAYIGKRKMEKMATDFVLNDKI